MAGKRRGKRRRGKKRRSTILVTVLLVYTVLAMAAAATLLIIDSKSKKVRTASSFTSSIKDGANSIIEGFESGNILIEIFPVKENSQNEIIPEASTVAMDVSSMADDTLSTKGAIIWPIKDLDIYKSVPGDGSAPAGNQYSDLIIGKAKVSSPLLVIDEAGDYFHVDCDGKDGYIDNRYCMINLPDYLGDELEYNITNSYSSIFMAHDYMLYGITGTIIPGFEEVKISEYEYLVPYLYPCSKKLHLVAQKVMEDGYKLKVYEAFRPYEATRFLYDTTLTFLDKHVPEKDENGFEIVEYDAEGNVILPLGEYPPAGSIVGYDGGVYTIDFAQQLAPAGSVTTYPPGTIVGENGIALDAAGNQLGIITISGGSTTETYANVITGGKYSLGAFLAAKASAHNKGIALDITLCDSSTKEDLKMQTQIHDLSYHSVLAQNNENAKLLARYMKDGGFNDLSSEWWHFQDDDTKNKLNINFVVNEGVKLPD